MTTLLRICHALRNNHVSLTLPWKETSQTQQKLKVLWMRFWTITQLSQPSTLYTTLVSTYNLSIHFMILVSTYNLSTRCMTLATTFNRFKLPVRLKSSTLTLSIGGMSFQIWIQCMAINSRPVSRCLQVPLFSHFIIPLKIKL